MKVTALAGGPLRIAAGLLLLSALTGCGQGALAPGALAPRLVITSYFPVTVAGRDFRPGETVALRAQPREAGLKPVRVRVLARSDGSFLARLRGYGLDRCTGFAVTATGSNGSQASVASPSFACPPVPAPSAGAPAALSRRGT